MDEEWSAETALAQLGGEAGSFPCQHIRKNILQSLTICDVDLVETAKRHREETGHLEIGWQRVMSSYLGY